jgi:HlyD family secretion protein
MLLMIRKQWIGWGIAGLLATGVGLWVAVRPDAPAPAAPARAGQTTTPREVGALGRIEPRSEIIKLGSVADEWVAEVLVEHGDEVKQGQTLARLRSYGEHIATRDRVVAQIAESERLQKAVRSSGEAAIREAELRVQSARENYPLRLSAQESKLRKIEAELTNNQDILDGRQKLYAQKMQARRDVDNQATLVRQNKADLASETEELNRLRKDMQIEQAASDAALNRARAELDRARAAIGIDSLKMELAVANARAENATLRAPVAGRVLKIHRRPGERVGDGPVITMGDTREMHAVAEVYETDIGRVRMGQRATVSSATLGAPLQGKVVRIGNMIFKNDVLNVDPAARIDARVVEVRILLEDGARVANLSNLSVDVVIHADQESVAEKR